MKINPQPSDLRLIDGTKYSNIFELKFFIWKLKTQLQFINVQEVLTVLKAVEVDFYVYKL